MFAIKDTSQASLAKLNSTINTLLSIAYSGGMYIKPQSITGDKIADETIEEGHIKLKTITAPLIDDSAIIAEKIADCAVTYEKLGKGSVYADNIAANQILANHIAAGAVTSDAIGANSVLAKHIAAEQIESNHLASKCVTAEKIDTNSVNADFIKTFNLKVGDEIQMGPNARISWSNIDDIPNDIVYGDTLSNTLNTALEGMLTTDNFGTVITKDYIASMGLVVGKEILMGPDAVIEWSNLTEDTQETIKSYAGKDGKDGKDGEDSYIPDWVSFTEASKDFVKSGLLQGNEIYTSTNKNNWIELSGGNIYFKHKDNNDNVTTVFNFSIDESNEGKPQLFLSDGCSIDTYYGYLRLRYDDYNYVSVQYDKIAFYVGGEGRGYIDSEGFKDSDGNLISGSSTTARVVAVFG